MREPLRSQYLAALGIDNYLPRFVLPGAKLSQPCEWLDIDVDAAPESESAVAIDVAATNSVVARANAIVDAERKPALDSIATESNRRAKPSFDSVKKSAATNAAAGPQFALSIVLAHGGLLLIDAAPLSSAERSDYQKLLNNFLPALRPAAAQYVLDIFSWPLLKNPQLSRDADAARETLHAFLSKQIEQRAIDTVLLLGAEAQQWCGAAIDTNMNVGSVRTVQSHSLLACVRDPALKRQLWNDVRHLAAR